MAWEILGYRMNNFRKIIVNLLILLAVVAVAISGFYILFNEKHVEPGAALQFDTGKLDKLSAESGEYMESSVARTGVASRGHSGGQVASSATLAPERDTRSSWV